MPADFTPVSWDDALADDLRQLVRLALDEDLEGQRDWTTASLVGEATPSAADVVSRQHGVFVGERIAAAVFAAAGAGAECEALAHDGDLVEPGQAVLRLTGLARDLLTCERTVLNFLGRLSGVASLAKQYADAIAGTTARVYDTRKTLPGWRRLDKYAVRMGGGSNHRTGLYDAVMIKDNHLAHAEGLDLSPAGALERSRAECARLDPAAAGRLVYEIEVDSLDQLRDALMADPDVVLLDNMSNEQLSKAVAIRNERSSEGASHRAVLEASGGVNLNTIAGIARTGVDRISVGALTHSAPVLDLGLDWKP
ncbi:Nicotinate-nucleotide pyrophosphorylase [carboxylating] [Pseudobythopirellula maris]|uniref:Probable nicotinate-nucleotide pyrophosphorylase [carboxylating] n=1 Tax=Pseudobythopirellula maris TaxID=2527991 RepID=A0A5C5ZJE1_9BACT|nr:carboxylating nicotinate-nucleotide diphosphorylase [Pseudobythopirellula maris]TWT87376.1 Nicotinate-nucleotide pyrophosphorylase [carboxylating] [Pseudobythopirellula maris]